MLVKCYTQWRSNGELKCLCKLDNPACDQFLSCSIEEFKYDKYQGLKSCMGHDSHRKVRRKWQQKI